MRELDPEPIPQVFERLLRVLFISQQGVAGPDLPVPGRLAVPLHPRLEELLGLLKLFGVEVMQGMVVIEVFRSRNELLEGDGTVARKGEIFDEIDFTGPDRGR